MSYWMLILLGVLAFLAPTKFGTPVVLQASLEPPGRPLEWLFFSWPNEILALVALLGLVWFIADRRRTAPRRDLLYQLPLGLLVAQLVALPASINAATSADTAVHFAVCTLVFYVTATYVRDGAGAARIFGGLGLASFLIGIFALEQWFGGLEQTRAWAAAYGNTDRMPPELLQRLTSNRVFSTLVYPNALAGFIVVAAGPTLAWIWYRARTWDRGVKWFALGLMAVLLVGCLVLTGSRGGYLAFAAGALVAVVAALERPGRRSLLVVGMVAVALLVVFGLAVQAGLVRLGGRSANARLDYWRGAAAIARDHPWRGTGPGTFGSIYPSYKTADTEEAQVAHNDYLQLWADSGILAFVCYVGLAMVGVADAIRLTRRRRSDPVALALCLALVGWAVHGLVDFDLYVPGVAVPVFLLLGVLQGLKERSVATEPAVGPARRWWLAVALVLVVGVAWLEGRDLVASHLHGRAHAIEEFNPTGACELNQAAGRLVPNNTHYAVTSGDLALARNKPAEAVQFYEQAIADDPYRAFHHYRLASAWRILGQPSRARAELERAIQLNPTQRRYRQELERFDAEQ